MRTPQDAPASLFEDLEDPNEITQVMDDAYPPRAEKRDAVVRIVEYSRYPRIARSERRMVGFTRNQSQSGLCVVASEAEAEGTLLRLALRTVDGGAALDALAHVAWCERRDDGRYWIGVALLECGGRRMMKVRRDDVVGRGEDAAESQRFASGDRRMRWLGPA